MFHEPVKQLADIPNYVPQNDGDDDNMQPLCCIVKYSLCTLLVLLIWRPTTSHVAVFVTVIHYVVLDSTR